MARLAAIVALLALALGCAGAPARIETPARDAQAVPWTHLEVRDAERDFKFALVADRTGGARPGVFETAIEKLALLEPAFVLSVGDLIEGYSEDPATLDAEWREFDAIVAGLSAPFFYAAGNHDYSNAVMAREWVRRFGPSYYHFLYEDVLFLVLNSELFASVSDPSRPVEGAETLADQMDYAERVLEEHADARWTVVVVHQPLWDRAVVHPEWERFEGLLGARDYTVFAGHYHAYTKHVRHDRSFLTLATSGGVSRLRGLDRGEFDHVALVSLGDRGPVVANLLLDGIHDEDVRTVATRRLVNGLSRVVTVEPVRMEGEVFEGGVQRIRLDNVSRETVRVQASFAPSPDFTPEPAATSVELAPGEGEVLEVRLRAPRPVAAAELRPGVASFTVEGPGGGEGRVRVESRGWLIPEPVFTLAPAPAQVRVDGELDEWGPLRFALEDWPRLEGGVAEASARFEAALGPDALYLAFDVRDATPYADPALPAGAQDGVRFSIDARPDPARSANPTLHQALSQRDFDLQLMGSITPRGAAPSEQGLLPPLPEGVELAVSRHVAGYRGEVRVPFAVLDERAGGAWRRFRLNAVLQDFRSGEAEGQSHPWRPVRYGTEGLPIEGAGTFERPLR